MELTREIMRLQEVILEHVPEGLPSTIVQAIHCTRAPSQVGINGVYSVCQALSPKAGHVCTEELSFLTHTKTPFWASGGPMSSLSWSKAAPQGHPPCPDAGQGIGPSPGTQHRLEAELQGFQVSRTTGRFPGAWSPKADPTGHCLPQVHVTGG